MEVLEFDDLRVRAAAVTDDQVDERMDLARTVFELDPSVQEEDFRWAARVSVGLDRLVDDFGLTAWPTTTVAWRASSTSAWGRA